VPKPYPYPPPGPALDFAVDGHSTGERFFTLGPRGISVRFTMAQSPGVTVTRLQFVIAAMHTTSPNINVRTFPVVHETWGPGVHTTTVHWDGTDDHGRRLPAGRYRIEARVSGTVPLPVTCKDDSGQGIELLTGVSGMDLNVYVRVPKP
jgi:hypothetical protein